MRKLILIAGLAASIAAPTFIPVSAEARTACERDRHEKRVVGTVAGGVLGGILGGAIAGRGSNTTGVLLGAGGGALVGNQLSKGRPCPSGYVARRSYSSSTTNVASTCSWRDQAYRDAYGNTVHRQVRVCR